MDKFDIAARVRELNRASEAYYNTGQPIMSDYEFDKKIEELKQWEEEKQQLKEKMWSMVMKSYDESMDDEEGVFTEKDEKVRSKSEKIIADKLNLMGIPYIYELPLHLDGLGYIKPDFTALNPDTREECIWEHFGMRENPEYASKAMNKLNVYARNGYTVGDNLIITMEGQSQPLNTRNLDKVIRKNLMT